MPMDPHVSRLVSVFALSGPRDSATADVGQRRDAFRSLMRFAGTGVRVAATEDRRIPGPAGPVAIRLYTPLRAAGDEWAGLVFLHGGGLVCGDLDTHDALCRALCDEAGCRVVAVDYRLAPEHPFPAAIEDAEAATLWVLDHAAALGLDPARIGIAGDSAGATLAAVICQRIAAIRPGALALQLLLCPILDWAADAATQRDFGQGFLLDRDMIERERACYLPAGQDASHPHVSPLRAVDLAGQPPAHIHTAEFDPVDEDGRAYAAKLRSAGVEVRHTCHAGMVHLFYGLGRMVPYAHDALKRIGADVGAALT